MPLIRFVPTTLSCKKVSIYERCNKFSYYNALRPRQNDRQVPDDIFKCIFLNANLGISLKISLKFVPKAPIDNIPALVPILAWRRPDDKPLSEPMMVSLPTYICVSRPQRIKTMFSVPDFPIYFKIIRTLISCITRLNLPESRFCRIWPRLLPRSLWRPPASWRHQRRCKSGKQWRHEVIT